MTGWLSTLSISNLMGGQGMELWRENLLGVIGGVCSAIIVAWLRWRWEHRDRRDTRVSRNFIVEHSPAVVAGEILGVVKFNRTKGPSRNPYLPSILHHF